VMQFERHIDRETAPRLPRTGQQVTFSRVPTADQLREPRMRFLSDVEAPILRVHMPARIVQSPAPDTQSFQGLSQEI
jgi:hypothetical protein